MDSNDSSKKNVLRASHVPPNCPIFGAPKPLPGNMLPTYEDVLKCHLYERFQVIKRSKKDPSAKLITRNISENIKTIWDKASIPTVSDKRINKKKYGLSFKL